MGLMAPMAAPIRQKHSCLEDSNLERLMSLYFGKLHSSHTYLTYTPLNNPVVPGFLCKFLKDKFVKEFFNKIFLEGFLLTRFSLRSL